MTQYDIYLDTIIKNQYLFTSPIVSKINCSYCNIGCTGAFWGMAKYMRLVSWIIIKQQKVDNDEAINQLTKNGLEGRVYTVYINYIAF